MLLVNSDRVFAALNVCSVSFTVKIRNNKKVSYKMRIKTVRGFLQRQMSNFYIYNDFSRLYGALRGFSETANFLFLLLFPWFDTCQCLALR